MKPKELIKDNYYHIEEGDREAIFKYNDINSTTNVNTFEAITNFNTNPSYEFKKRDEFWIKDRNCRLATEEEIDWLKRCVAENGIVKRNCIINDFQIY